jgi:hypothetical protein
MRLNSAIIFSAVAFVAGLALGRPHFWWVPLTVLFAGFVDLWTRAWVMSPRLGAARNLSMVLKSICALLGLYAMLGQLICVGLLIWWIVSRANA